MTFVQWIYNSRNNLRDTSEFHGAHHPYPIAHLNCPFIHYSNLHWLSQITNTINIPLVSQSTHIYITALIKSYIVNLYCSRSQLSINCPWNFNRPTLISNDVPCLINIHDLESTLELCVRPCPLGQVTSDDRFCAEMGKDWDVSPADHVDVRIYVYLKVSVCLSIYLILYVICIVYQL